MNYLYNDPDITEGEDWEDEKANEKAEFDESHDLASSDGKPM